MKHRAYHLIWVFVLVIMVAACGGGGGGGAGSGGVAYTGITAQAPLTAANANAIFSMIWNGGMSTGSISPSPSISKSASSGGSNEGGIVFFAKRLGARLRGDVVKFSGGTEKMQSTVPINDTTNGRVSGTLTMTGSIDDTTLTGSITMTYTNFNDGDGFTVDGVVTLRVDGFDGVNGIFTDATMSFTSWSMKSAGVDFTLGGSIRIQESMQGSSDTLTMNMTGRDNIGNDSFKFENYVETTVYDNLLYPTGASETYSGRVYVAQYGYVDVNTVSPCIYTDPNSDPGSGGPIILAGAGNTKAAITPISTSYVKIEVDNNGDGAYEDKNAYAWNNLEGTPVALSCIANAGPDQNVNMGTLVTLDGSGSTDFNGGTLTYAWTMTTKPFGSNAALSNSAAIRPTFIADLDGTYTVSLVVSNGTTTSSPDTVVITAAYVYSSLFANAGPSQSVTTGSVVTLDGSGSWNMKGGALTYSWTMTSKPNGSSAVLSNPSSKTTTFTADVAGSYTINLIVSNGTAYSSPSTVVVTATVPLSLLSIQLSPNNRSIVRDTIQHFRAVGLYTDGNERDVGASATWMSSNTNVAMISGVSGIYGVVAAVSSGTTTISASLGGISGSAALTVVDWPSSPGNYVYLQSDTGDYIGLGNSYSFTQANAQFGGSAAGGLFAINITGNQTWWGGDFVVPNSMSQLQVGYYDNLTRYPFNDPAAGGLTWYGDGRGCNILTGWFAIDNVTYNTGNLTSIELRFEQHCEGASPALYGWIHWTQ